MMIFYEFVCTIIFINRRFSAFFNVHPYTFSIILSSYSYLRNSKKTPVKLANDYDFGYAFKCYLENVGIKF